MFNGKFNFFNIFENIRNKILGKINHDQIWFISSRNAKMV